MSPQRIDHYDSPDAPKANSLVPAVNVVVANDAAEILLIRRTNNGNWAVPGGAIDLGESVALTASDETVAHGMQNQGSTPLPPADRHRHRVRASGAPAVPFAASSVDAIGPILAL
jgi:hypothetical protein